MMEFIKKHKKVSIFVGLVILIIAYFVYKNYASSNQPLQYTVDTAQKGTIIVSTSGTGQISNSNQLDVKSKESGNITKIMVKIGDKVKAGDLLVQLDDQDASKAVRDARASLAAAQISLEKLKRGALPQDRQAVIDKYANAQQDLIDVQAKNDLDLANTYTAARNTLSDSYSKASDIINRQVNDFLDNPNSSNPKLAFATINSQAQNNTQDGRVTAGAALSEIANDLPPASADPATIDTDLDKVSDQLKVIKSFLNSLNDAVNYGLVSADLSDATLSSYKSTVYSARTSVDTLINNIVAQKTAITNQLISNRDSLRSAQDALSTAKTNLDAQNAGPDNLDVASQSISVQQKANALSDAGQRLADAAIRAPFDGIVANIDLRVGDYLAANSAATTLITAQSLADISLNEVDAVKVKVGQKVDLTFDAISDLEITGSVASIESIGTVSQGVVTYDVKINLDTQDDRIKTGMSVSATIITDSVVDALTVPNSAVKTQGTTSYVQVFSPPLVATSSTGATASAGIPSILVPTRQTVTIGLSNDTLTEITSGLNEGDQIVTKITDPNKKTTTASSATSATSLLGGSRGGAAAGGGATRALGR